FVGKRLNNVYDIDKKTFIFKFNPADDLNRKYILFRAGSRLHITEYEWPKSNTPRGHTVKMRKLLSNSRCIDVFQPCKFERIAIMKFQNAGGTFNLHFELYDKGNLILTSDEDNKILMQIRMLKNKDPTPKDDKNKSFFYQNPSVGQTYIEPGYFEQKLAQNKNALLLQCASSRIKSSKSLIQHILKKQFDLNGNEKLESVQKLFSGFYYFSFLFLF
ncbi:MAG: hypothetical protein MHPSP_002195, partial [Paramarteilia canceri]